MSVFLFVLGVLGGLPFALALGINAGTRAGNHTSTDKYILAFQRTKWLIAGVTLFASIFAASFYVEQIGKTPFELAYQQCMNKIDRPSGEDVQTCKSLAEELVGFKPTK